QEIFYLAKKFVIQLISNQTSETIIIVLQYGGGIIAVIGLVIAITGISANGEINSIKSSLRRLEPRIQNLPTSQPKTQTSTCRFCGAEIALNDLFCPGCGRSKI
ncbi:zinc ribbon domain-containing protein, partial [Candidatus Bathyarchaeota archaeon]|nr:zinc ribbon domain-containing protein [Candidatus Bathyarchaeota archaeon]